MASLTQGSLTREGKRERSTETRTYAQRRRAQVAKRVAEVLQREAVQGERRVRQHVPRPNNERNTLL